MTHRCHDDLHHVELGLFFGESSQFVHDWVEVVEILEGIVRDTSHG